MIDLYVKHIRIAYVSYGALANPICQQLRFGHSCYGHLTGFVAPIEWFMSQIGL